MGKKSTKTTTKAKSPGTKKKVKVVTVKAPAGTKIKAPRKGVVRRSRTSGALTHREANKLMERKDLPAFLRANFDANK